MSTVKASDSLDELLQKVRLATRTSNGLDVDTNVCPHCGNKRHSNPYANLKNLSGVNANSLEGTPNFVTFLLENIQILFKFSIQYHTLGCVRCCISN